MTLTKADLAQQVYNQHKGIITRIQAKESVEAFLRISKDSLIGGSDLLLSGFGKFNVKDKKPRRGRNPQTGEDLILDARRVVTFKPARILRDKVNGSELLHGAEKRQETVSGLKLLKLLNRHG